MLDKPFALPANTPLAVTVLSSEDIEFARERAAWVALSAESIARAYSDDEPEYTLDNLRE